MTPRPDVSAERKQQILDAAMTVFSRQGFYETRMDDIVQESGLSKGTLYWYFKSKDDLILAILGTLFDHGMDNLQELQEVPDSARKILFQLMEQTVANIQQMFQLMPLNYEFYAMSFRSEEVRQVLRQYMHQYLGSIIPIIQKGIDQGEFRPIDPKDAVVALAALFEGTLLLWVYDPELIDLEYHLECNLDLLLNGLLV